MTAVTDDRYALPPELAESWERSKMSRDASEPPWEPVEERESFLTRRSGGTSTNAIKRENSSDESTWVSSNIDVRGDHLNARFFLEQHGHNVRYAPELRRWFVWNGNWWAEDRDDRVHELARKTVDGLRKWVSATSDADEMKRRLNHYLASTGAAKLDALLKVARSVPGVVVTVDALDTHPYLLACINGTIDLQTGELQQPNRDHLMTRGVNVNYLSGARSAEWEEFVNYIFVSDSKTVGYIQKLLGSFLTGSVGDQLLPIFHGLGKNGKSTLLGAVQHILGPYAITAPDGLLVAQKFQQHPERLAVLRGRRMVVSYELEAKVSLAEGLVKTLTGDDTITAREMRGHRFEFRPTHHLSLVTNHRPIIRGTDVAIWRRVKLIPFEVVIPQEKRIKDYRDRLVTEHGEAILAWLVTGAVVWCRDGLGECPAVTAATEKYRRDEDVISEFVRDCIEVVDGEHIFVAELYDVWKTWATANGERLGRLSDFRASLLDHGLEIRSFYDATKRRDKDAVMNRKCRGIL